ncbi:hypothetical protein AMC87_PD00129 (plasmid) [Rhizobium phaseoli]|nr:hypothetical protein AMC88_PD00726 [Rhizobium phaseoli]ANL50256.1 hypothetical protein AMC87_PD00129 [Rhizobium phaseoli]ANL56588.1 hypothetical protein AMC86_PD00128 [Rhizobium phaseoli]ANL63532.1 hypothetical protein AMC85_PD00727 [Rhizobium phaseoli]
MLIEVAFKMTTFLRFLRRWIVISIVALVSTFYLVKFLTWGISPVIGLLFIFFWPVWVPPVVGMMAFLGVLGRRRDIRSNAIPPSTKVPYYSDEFQREDRARD